MIALVLESSTSSAKAMIFNTETLSFSQKTIPYSKQVSNNPEGIFQETMRLGRSIAETLSVDVIALSSTWHSLMVCDKDMVPRTPLWNWFDVQASDLCKTLRKDSAYVDSYYRSTGCMVHSIYPYFKLKQMHEEGFLFDTDRVCDQGSYTFHKLTGKWKVTRSMASGMGLLDTHSRNYLSSLKQEIGVNPNTQLGELVDYTDIGRLSSEGAKLLGLRAGTPILPCLPDGGLNQVGSNALDNGVMTLSMGTSGALRLSTDRPVFSQDYSTWCYLSPRKWLLGAATSGCCNCVDWVKQRMFSPNLSYGEIESRLDSSRETPIFLPFLYGERCPGWQDERHAAFLDVKPYHTAEDHFQSVLEGVLFNLYQCYGKILQLGIPIQKIKLSGGVLHSQIWKNMCVNLFGVPIEEDYGSQSSLLGGLQLGLEVLGTHEFDGYFDKGGTMLIPDKEIHSQLVHRFQQYEYWYERTRV